MEQTLITSNRPAPPSEPDDSPQVWVDRFGDQLLRMALCRVADRDTAEDVVQETFLAAWRGRDAFDGRSSLGTWLGAILKRKIADHYRQLGRRPEIEHQEELELFDHHGKWRRRPGELDVPAADQVERSEFWQVLELCLADLPQTLAQAFCLREVQAASPEDVCQRLGISRKNLSVRMHRARLLLRECLEGRWLNGGQR